MRVFRCALPALSLGFVLLFFSGCSEEPAGPGLSDLTKVHVDFQEGFRGNFISMAIDGVEHGAVSIDSVVTSNPEATFMTYLVPGEYSITVRWKPVGLDKPATSHSFPADLRDGDVHYIGVSTIKGKFIYEVQTEPFSY